MKAIYQKKTYIFDIQITINDVAPDISADVVKVRLGKNYNMLAPEIEVNADVISFGNQGIAMVEFTTTHTDIPTGQYYLQAVWELDGSTRKFMVIDTTIKVKHVIG